ncbi:hypothetical protein DFH07DRAFT_796416 [Mycena maculata]|uniref:Vacuolar protein sorting-associated protein 13 second N-terminal domain-containing protein n=1 Tax=Mycena maculata TaxID=230809 RepID=A0AAD7K601_9AGAR|nr:hypothetical protein DFH07DRAFT_796416 [Mycena maculata]
MPMPRLFKKLSEKNFRKRMKSTASSKDSPPPLPISATTDADLNKPFPPTPKTPTGNGLPPNGAPYPPSPPPNGNGLPPNGAPYYPPPPAPHVNGNAANGNDVPQDDFSQDLADAWKSASTEPKTSKADKVLLTMETGVAQGDTIMTTIKTALDGVSGLEVIENGINSFMEGMPVLMNALDEVAKLHPFIGVAVMAFKAVWALEQKRRDNDKKILALHMEMKDMMSVLTQLKNVKDAEEVAPDGSTIKGRMQEIVKATVADIKACANACDTYVKKKLVVKILKGPIWDGKLVAFVGAFTKHRSEFEFALAIHTSVGVDQANKTLDSVDQTTQEMNMKMDMMMKMFQQFVSPEQKEMARMIEAKGGQAVLNDDKVLKELNDIENQAGSQASSSHNKTARVADLDDLKEDLHMDPDVAIRENEKVFERKFEIQMRQIVDQLSRVVEREGDRVISAVTAGPHDRIIDPDVHMIWKEMGWRGSVKSRHFVMALRDHFAEENKNGEHDHAPMTVDKTDEWALEYFNIVRLQPISEAFDDDASGFVTVSETNAFTTERPLGWSLPQWIAYWAIGHHQTMYTYATKIKEILAKMFAIVGKMLPINKGLANTYLRVIYNDVYTLSASVNECYVNNGLQERFASYVASEEARLRTNLEAIKYDIDAIDTVPLITGQGRIDRYILPLVYLLLERHFEIFRACQTHIVDADELADAYDTMQYAFDVVHERVAVLQAIFKAQKLNLHEQFQSFSHGLYADMNEPKLLEDPKLVQEAEFPDFPYDDSVEAQDVDINKIMNYSFDEELLDFPAYTSPKTEAQLDVTDPAKLLPAFKGMLGLWHGFTYWPASSKWPTAGMISMLLEPSSVDGQVQNFTADDRVNRTNFQVLGQCRAGDEPGVVVVTFKRTFSDYPTQYYSGTWDVAKDRLSGTLGFVEDATKHTAAYMFTRMKPEDLCFAPAPVELETNKARALWGFAIAATVQAVRRRRWSWSFFKERRDSRRRFIELYTRSDLTSTRFGTTLNSKESEELTRLKKTFPTADGRFYHSLAERQIRGTTEHNVYCDNCRAYVGGARITCLVCQMVSSWNTVDFCDSPRCIDSRVSRDDMQKPHQPHHDLMKVRRVLHKRLVGKTFRDAKKALKHARTLIAGGEDSDLDLDSGSKSESESDTEDEEGHPPLSAVSMSKRMSRVPVLTVTIPQEGTSRPKSTILTPTSSKPPPVPSGPACSNCSKQVSMPCWYCVQCAGSTFICWECDMKAEISFGTHDFHTHDLVRVTKPVEEKDLTVEERLTEIEGRFIKHEKIMDERLNRLEAAVGGRMVKVENLLEQLLIKLEKS